MRAIREEVSGVGGLVAGAGAAGTVGGANNINQIISTIIAQLNGNRTVTGTP